MKLMHLSDLHLGKRINEFSMIEDQAYILLKIIEIIDNEKPDAIMIAGDIYDKSVPSAEAVSLLDDFLVRLSKRNLKVFIISGNHDSPERIAFGNKLINQSGVYLSPVYNGEISPIMLEDEFGAVKIFMLPFIKPVHVKRYFEDEKIDSYTEAVRIAVETMDFNTTERNILVAHQFVTGASRCESEDISIGGLDNVDANVFGKFDYVALGHLHGPQNIGKETIRYCGTPLKYSFSESNHIKSVTLVDLLEKGVVQCRCIPLVPKRDMREIKGKYSQIESKEYYIETNTDDYIHITLTDEDEVPNALGKLRKIYKNIMKLDYDNTRTRANTDIAVDNNVENKTPIQLFDEFYEMQNNQKMTEQQYKFTLDLIENIWRDGE